MVPASAVNPSGINTLLANYWSTFFINGTLILVKGPKSLPRNPPIVLFWTAVF